MQKIDLSSLISLKGLDRKEVAKHLFPKNKYPDLALNDVLKGKLLLNADQISKLAALAGVSITELFSGEQWSTVSKEGVHTFTNGEFKAELDSSTWITKVFHKGSLFHETVIHTGEMALSQYLDKLSLIINTKK